VYVGGGGGGREGGRGRGRESDRGGARKRRSYRVAKRYWVVSDVGLSPQKSYSL